MTCATAQDVYVTAWPQLIMIRIPTTTTFSRHNVGKGLDRLHQFEMHSVYLTSKDKAHL